MSCLYFGSEQQNSLWVLASTDKISVNQRTCPHFKVLFNYLCISRKLCWHDIGCSVADDPYPVALIQVICSLLSSLQTKRMYNMLTKPKKHNSLRLEPTLGQILGQGWQSHFSSNPTKDNRSLPPI